MIFLPGEEISFIH